MPPEIAVSCALACSTVTPGFRRPNDARNHTSDLSSPDCGPRKTASAQTGTATSNVRPTSTPVNDGGVTPTMSRVWPLSRMVRPTAPGSPPYSRRQNASLSTAPGAAHPFTSSAAVSSPPTDGCTPSVAKYDPLTYRPAARRTPPPAVRLQPVEPHVMIDENTRCTPRIRP